MAAWRDDERAGNSAVQSCQDSLVGPGKPRKVPVCRLLCGSHPLREVGDVVAIGNENPVHCIAIFQLEQELARLCDGSAILLSLSQHAHKAQFGDRTRCQFRTLTCPEAFDPTRSPRMKLMLQYGQRQQSVHVQKVSHGKSARISRTSALVSWGALGPAVRTGNPVTPSRMIRAFRERTFRGVRTICCPSTLASSESPGCSPSLRRILLGTTTWPFVETVVNMVRLSYHE